MNLLVFLQWQRLPLVADELPSAIDRVRIRRPFEWK
jgi:hypothetical protein